MKTQESKNFLLILNALPRGEKQIIKQYGLDLMEFKACKVRLLKSSLGLDIAQIRDIESQFNSIDFCVVNKRQLTLEILTTRNIVVFSNKNNLIRNPFLFIPVSWIKPFCVLDIKPVPFDLAGRANAKLKLFWRLFRFHRYLYLSDEQLKAVGIKRGRKVRESHSFDFLEVYRNRSVDEEKRFITYIDTNLSFHLANPKNTPGFKVDYIAYFEKLKNAFALLSKTTSMEIQFLLHPSTLPEHRRLYEENFPNVVYGNTCAYTKRSAMVVCHQSTALNFAVYYDKPILLLACAEMNQSDVLVKIQKNQAKILGLKVLNLDEPVVNHDLLVEVDTERYNYYQTHFIIADGVEHLYFEQ